MATKTTRRKTAAERTAGTRTTARKAPAKKASAGKASAGKASAGKAAAKVPAKKAPTKKVSGRKAPAKKAPAKKAAANTGAGRYTDPELRERLKARILKGSKGGKPGQWSARKAQLLAHDYEAEGGGYRGGRSAAQRHLASWTDEHWTTADGEKAARRGGTTRYLPEQAWSTLSEGEKAATNRKKVEGSRRGRQHVANTARAKHARKAAAR